MSVLKSFSSYRQFLFIGIALCTMLGISFLTPAVDGLSAQAKVTLGIGAFAIIVWITQSLDDAQSGFCIVAFLVLLKATKVGTALSGYSNSGVWIVMLGMIMAAAMEKSGLSKRMALYLVSVAGKSASNLYWMFGLITLVMTFFIPSIAAKTLLLIPILTQMGAAFGATKGNSNLVKGLLFIVTITGTMFSISSLTSHAANPLTASFIDKQLSVTVHWADWFLIGGPPGILCGLLALPVIRWMWPPDISDIAGGQSLVRAELAKLGSMTGKEVYTLIIFVLTLALWATDKLHGVSATIVAMLTVIAIILPGRQQIMTWKEAEKKLPWNVFIVYGAGISMGSTLVETGAARWVAETYFSHFSAFGIQEQVVIFIWVMLILQVLFTGAGPKTTALTPVIIAYAQIHINNPAPFVLLIGMNMLHQYLLPVSNLPNIVGLATEEITAKELIKTGAVMSIFGAAFMSLMVYTYWKWIGVFDWTHGFGN